MIQTPIQPRTDTRPHHRFTVDDYEKMVDLGILTEDHPVVLIRGEVVDRATWQSRYRFTSNECRQMLEHGIISRSDSVELGQGEVLADVSIKPSHAVCVTRIHHRLIRILGEQWHVRSQNPIHLVDSEPEPDLSVMKHRDDFYAGGHPRAADIVLVVEVADASLNNDRAVKGPIYAEGGIVEYWIVNLNDESVEVYRSPQTDGTYADKAIFCRGDKIEILAIPEVQFEVADLLIP
jgi:Uma2 family endonuclease